MKYTIETKFRPGQTVYIIGYDYSKHPFVHVLEKKVDRIGFCAFTHAIQYDLNGEGQSIKQPDVFASKKEAIRSCKELMPDAIRKAMKDIYSKIEANNDHNTRLRAAWHDYNAMLKEVLSGRKRK